MTGEALLVGCAIVAPMVFPQVLPRAALVTSLLPPVPPGPPKPPPDRPHTSQPAHARPEPQYRLGAVYIPTTIPQHAQIIEDPPDEPMTGGVYVPGSPDSGGPGGGGSALINGILGGTGTAPPPRPRVETARPPEPPPAAPTRVRQGGLVKPAALLQRVDPVYPPLARQMRVAGTVELQGVIGTDGHIRELKVINGHPLLTRAALDAVSQWVYAPTRLNSELVEVITTITVTFHLN
ncbi:MAG TPA: energy transducer TonB [Bryobacteraceae bacterium]|nr:energy transducer TonB [Bryobacteraceae bacterium]